MASIDLSSMKSWNDKDVMTGAQYDAERNQIITAVNDNATQITNTYTKTQVDQKVAAMATTVTIASGTTYPTVPTTGMLFYRTDLHALYEYDATNGWQLNVKAGTGVTIGTDGTISIANGSATSAGALQVGSGLNVNNGVISADNLMWMIHMGMGGF